MEILETNPFRRTSAGVLWGRLSTASTAYPETGSNTTERKQRSAADKNIENRLKLLLHIYQRRQEGIEVDPFMGVESPHEAQGSEFVEGWDALLWNGDSKCKPVKQETEDMKVIETADGKIVVVRVEEYLTPAYRGESAPSWSPVDTTDWESAPQNAIKIETSTSPENTSFESFDDLVHWYEDWTPGMTLAALERHMPPPTIKQESQ